jgi:hypothetical protein
VDNIHGVLLVEISEPTARNSRSQHRNLEENPSSFPRQLRRHLYIQTDGIKKKPAGKIADDLKAIIEDASGRFPELHLRMKEFQAEFKVLVHQRNNLLHANPRTAKGEEQRLLHLDRSDWTIVEIDERAKRFEVASAEAGILRGALISYPRITSAPQKQTH